MVQGVVDKYKFSAAERFAVWQVYKGECFWCGEPVSIQECTIDHVLPEDLLSKPEKLRHLIEQFGLPGTFKINGFENWVPCHFGCNTRKNETVYRKSQVMLAILSRLQQNAPKVEKQYQIVLRSREKSSILGRVAAMAEQQQITKDEVLVLFGETEKEIAAIKAIPQEIFDRLSQRWSIVSADHNLGTATDGRLVGVTWIGPSEPDSSWRCPACGSCGPWSGARCLNCGSLSDD